MSKKRNAARERKKPLNNSLRIVRKTTSWNKDLERFVSFSFLLYTLIVMWYSQIIVFIFALLQFWVYMYEDILFFFLTNMCISNVICRQCSFFPFFFFFFFFFSILSLSFVILMIVMVPESITSVGLHVDATLISSAIYQSAYVFRCDEPKAFIIVVWLSRRRDDTYPCRY